MLWLRHFNPRLEGREDKPVRLPLVRHAPGEAVFEGAGTEGLLRIIYRKTGPDELVGAVERGKIREEFRFRRAAG